MNNEKIAKLTLPNGKLDIKLIALDLDGTTLDEHGNLAAETANTLAAAVRAGVHVVVNTGRPFCALPKEIFGVDGIEYVITGNGSRTVRLSDNTPILSSCHSPEAVKMIVDLLEGTSNVVEVISGGFAFMEKDVWENLESYHLSPGRTEYLIRTRKPIENIYGYLRQHDHEIEDIIIDFPDSESRQKLWDVLEPTGLMTVTSSSSTNMELGSPTTTKANGVIELGKLLGIKPENMMACGDSLNDLAMLQACGFGVAMGNSTKEILEAADFVTLTNAEHGVAHAIKKFVLL